MTPPLFSLLSPFVILTRNDRIGPDRTGLDVLTTHTYIYLIHLSIPIFPTPFTDDLTHSTAPHRTAPHRCEMPRPALYSILFLTSYFVLCTVLFPRPVDTHEKLTDRGDIVRRYDGERGIYNL